MITEDQIVAVTVFLTVRDDNGKVTSHCVDFKPKGARKILGFLKHNVCGGRLVMSEQNFNLTKLDPEEQRIIITAP